MKLTYAADVDAAAVLMREEGVTWPSADNERLDMDRIVDYDADGRVIEYEFLNVRRYGVRLDDLVHREKLARLFADAGFEERDWGHPVGSGTVVRVRISLEGDERQMVLTALAHEASEMPGWQEALEQLADQLHGRDIFKRIKAQRDASRRQGDPLQT